MKRSSLFFVIYFIAAVPTFKFGQRKSFEPVLIFPKLEYFLDQGESTDHHGKKPHKGRRESQAERPSHWSRGDVGLGCKSHNHQGRRGKRRKCQGLIYFHAIINYFLMFSFQIRTSSLMYILKFLNCMR